MIIDVSATYQPSIDWRQVAAAGVTGAWLKATEGTSWPAPGSREAPWWSVQQGAAMAAGVPTGSYHLARPDLHPGSPGAVAEAQHYLAATAGRPGRLGDALDLEPDYVSALPPEQLAGWVVAFAQTVEAARSSGRITLYMARDTLWQLGTAYPAGRPLWLAWPGWTGQPLPTGTTLVQIGARAVPGIPGPVDVNITPQEDDMTPDQANQLTDTLATAQSTAKMVTSTSNWVVDPDHGIVVTLGRLTAMVAALAKAGGVDQAALDAAGQAGAEAVIAEIAAAAKPATTTTS